MLFLDGEPDVRRLFLDMMKPVGVPVLLAANAAEAERALDESSEPIGLALAELFEERAGLLDVERLRRHSHFADAPFGFLSHRSDALARLQALASGAKFFFPMPFDPVDLRRKIRRIVGGSGGIGHSDLRVFPRFNHSVPGTVHRTRPETGHPPRAWPQQIRNLSGGGFSFLSPESHEIGERLRADLELSGETNAFHAFAEVVWVRRLDTGFLVGAQYLVHAPERFLPLVDFVDLHRLQG